MNSFNRIGFTLFLTFTITAIVSVMFVYPAIDRMTESVIGDRLLYAKNTIDESFKQKTPKEWQSTSIEVADKINMNIYIDRLSDSYIPQQFLEKLSGPIGQNGIIELETLQVYYPLTDDFILSAGPLTDFGWIIYAPELTTWLIALCMALAIAYYFYQRDRQALQTLARLLPALQTNEAVKGPLDLTSLSHRINRLSEKNDNKSDALEKLIISQRDLLHGIAHEVRSPLARMEFAIELLQTADEQEQIALSLQLDKYLKEVDELVRELLRYSRLQHNESQIQLSNNCIESLIDSSLEKVESVYPAITFNIKDRDNISLNCDKNLMIIALANILRNAGRFAKQQCDISWQLTKDNIVIMIEDDGVGLPPGKTQQIFEPFTRLDPSRSRDSGGHGLGLAIVQAIVHRHNGRVVVQDADIGGARFEIIMSRNTG